MIKILVVDGNAAFATMLQEMLETEGGYHVRVAPGGSSALAALERDRFDLTIVDMDLDPEEMDYRELIRRIRRVKYADLVAFQKQIEASACVGSRRQEVA